jgi:hypothetical protein
VHGFLGTLKCAFNGRRGRSSAIFVEPKFDSVHELERRANVAGAEIEPQSRQAFA